MVRVALCDGHWRAAVDDKVQRIELCGRKKVPLLKAGENGVS